MLIWGILERHKGVRLAGCEKAGFDQWERAEGKRKGTQMRRRERERTVSGGEERGGRERNKRWRRRGAMGGVDFCETKQGVQ